MSVTTHIVYIVSEGKLVCGLLVGDFFPAIKNTQNVD